MTQIALPFAPVQASPQTAAPARPWRADRPAAWRQRGPAAEPVEPEQPARGVREAARRLHASPFARMWLDLRLRAWRRGVEVDTLTVTPARLARLSLGRCPVTRERFGATESGASGTAREAVALPLGEDATVRGDRLAVVCRRVAEAYGGLDLAGVQAQARRAACAAASPEGDDPRLMRLTPAEWSRLAGLWALAAGDGDGACASEVGDGFAFVLPPPRLTVRAPWLALQTLLSAVFLGDGWAPRIAALSACVPDRCTRQPLARLMSALLARRLAAAVPAHAPVGDAAARRAHTAALREVMEDAWSHPIVQRHWLALRAAWTPADALQVARQASRRAPPGAAWRWVEDAAETNASAPPEAVGPSTPGVNAPDKGEETPWPAAQPGAGPGSASRPWRPSRPNRRRASTTPATSSAAPASVGPSGQRPRSAQA